MEMPHRSPSEPRSPFRAFRVGPLGPLALATALLLTAGACRTTRQGQRDIVYTATKNYETGLTQYAKGCEVVPHLREDCDDFVIALRVDLQAIKEATPAIAKGYAPVQLARLKKTDSTVKLFIK